MAGIQDAIKEAQDAASKIAADEASAGTDIIEGSVNSSGQVQTYTPGSMSMSALITNNGVVPRSTPYLKVNEDGIKIGKDKQYIEGFKAKVLMVENEGFQPKMTIRFGNPAQYLSTYDFAACDKGGTWGDALQKAKMADPKAEPYPSVDVVLTLTEAVKLKEETLQPGQKVGFNSSKTNFSEWADFYQEVHKAGLLGQEIDVEVGFRDIDHGGNQWGVVTFTLL